MVDTLDIYTKLRASGLTARQSEAIAKVLFLVHSARSNNVVATNQSEARTAFARKNVEAD